MSLNFEKRRPDHAIGEFSATMEFFAPVGPKAYAEVKAEVERQAGLLEMPAPIRRQGLQITLGENGQGAVPAPVEGFGYQGFARSGEIDSALICEPDNVVFTTHSYSSWAEMLPKITDIFNQIGKKYLVEVPSISFFSVQYINEFRSRAPGHASPTEMIREDSQWVAPFVRGIDEFWHCHVGRFANIDQNSRFLFNVNFDIQSGKMPDKPAPVTTVRNLILSSYRYDVAGGSPLTVNSSELESEIGNHFDSAHNEEKRILAEIYTDDYLKEIGAL